MVIVDMSDTTTVTYTVTDDANARFLKRDDDDQGTSTLSTPATTTSTDCFETDVVTWVPYAPMQFVMGEEENTSSGSTTGATKVYRQNPTTTTTSTSVVTSPTTTLAVAVAPAVAAAPLAPCPRTRPAPAPQSGLYAITYTGYDPSTGECMSADAVLPDLQDIRSKGFPRIRMYSVDCNQLSTVADQAISLGLSLTMGVYIDDTGIVRGASDLAAIIAWGKWDYVDIILIGITSL